MGESRDEATGRADAAEAREDGEMESSRQADGDAENGAETLVDAPAAKRLSGEIGAVTPEPEEEAPTRTLARGQPSLDSSDAGSAPTTGGFLGTTAPTQFSSAASPVEALMFEEVTRTRTFLRIVLIICASMSALLPVLAGNRAVEVFLYGAMAACSAGAIWLHAQIRDPARYSPRIVMPVAILIAIATCAGVLYWGVFSPAPIIIVMGLYFFCRAQSFASAAAIFLLCAGFQVITSALILTDTIEDPGIITAGDRGLRELIFAQGMVQLINLLTFWLARVSRGATLRGIEHLKQVVRQVSQREALLQEARQDLDRALHIGGPGRYTDQIIESYQLGPVIGRGAMGEVYEATHTVTRDEAAVKLLHPQVLDSPNHVARFLREAKAINALQLPNVVRIVSASDPLAPVPYLIMERLYGHDLSHYLRKRRRLSARQIVTLLEHVGAVIDAAREKGIVHRDIKPQNLFLSEQPQGKPMWKILDFGVSKLGEHAGTLTQGHVVGTPAYMAPEQARGENVDHRADLYSLGAIAYRCATGQPPFTGKELPSVLHRVVYRMPPRPSDIAELAPDVDLVLAVALAKRAPDRFDTGSELAEAMELAFDGKLHEVTRRHARGLLAAMPWGAKS